MTKTTHRRSLEERLFERPQSFAFDQAVRILEALSPGAAPLGEGVDARLEAVRLSGPLTPCFPANAVESVFKANDDDARVALKTNLLGLGGPDGPLPYVWQETLLRRARNKDLATAAFLNIFQHRLLSYLYCGLNKHRPASVFLPPRNPLFGVLGAFAGDRENAAHAALFANQRRSGTAFLALLRESVDAPMSLAPFKGRWRLIPEEARTRLRRGGSGVRLGRGRLIGGRLWDEHAQTELTLGPLTMRQYLDHLPGAAGRDVLMAEARRFFSDDLELRLKLKLNPGDRQKARLSGNRPPRLGRTAWL